MKTKFCEVPLTVVLAVTFICLTLIFLFFPETVEAAPADPTSFAAPTITVEDEIFSAPTEIENVSKVPEPKLRSLGTFKLTFYCPCRECSGKWGHMTSSGARCTEGVTVACSYLPDGTRIYIEGWGDRIVQDTGVTGRHIDIFMESHSECLRNGVQKREVWIYE